MSELLLTVDRTDESTSTVRTLTLRADGPLPPFAPGSHLVLDCDGRRNAYSLVGDGLRPREYRISVLHHPDGAGGSRWLHRLRPGDTVRATGPRSRFAPALRARRHLLIAGGIGITALLPHVRAARQWNRPFELLYGYRRDAGAHLDELRALGPVGEFCGRRALTAALEDALTRQPLGTHLYVCGPVGLIEYTLAAAARLGWPPVRIHQERFEPAELAPGRPFQLRLRTGRVLAVASGRSALEALEKAGLDVPSQCRQGVCGECRLPLLAGRVEHRDSYLTAAEHAEGRSFMPCVSRALDAELLLSL